MTFIEILFRINEMSIKTKPKSILWIVVVFDKKSSICRKQSLIKQFLFWCLWMLYFLFFCTFWCCYLLGNKNWFSHEFLCNQKTRVSQQSTKMMSVKIGAIFYIREQHDISFWWYFFWWYFSYKILLTFFSKATF